MMKTLIERTENINFWKVFTTFFVALGGFAITYFIFMASSGEGVATNLLNRLTLAGFRNRLFTDMLVTFRLVSYVFLLGFHSILALWVYVDGKKYHCYSIAFPVLTLVTGVVGWLIYMIYRVDKVSGPESNKMVNINSNHEGEY